MSARLVVLVSLAAAVAACASSAPLRTGSRAAKSGEIATARLTLAPCAIPDLARPARCGTARVFENRALGRGRVIALKVVVVPATRTPAAPDPVVFITGGPGGAATDDVAGVLEESGAAAEARDFVFIDQRGMGRDSPLRCKILDGTNLGDLAGGALPEPRLRACLASMDADPAHYTTSAAVGDLDQVLRELGYGAAVNVMGVSYGTFVAQAFAHAYPARVRSLVLNGVATPRGNFLRFAASSERVLAQVFAACEVDPTCHAQHPSPRREMESAMARLRAHPETVSAEGPDSKTYSATLDAGAFAMAIRASLYSARNRAHVMDVIHDVAEGHLDSVARAVVWTPLAISDVSVGGYLSIACSEELPGVTMADAERACANTFLGTARIAPLLHACTFWPKGADAPWLHEPLRADVPTLLLGGTMDPSTPTSNMAEVAATLTHAQSVVVPGEAHAIGGPCVAGIVAAFLETPLAKVDAGCVKPLR
jgi:pimeloyl-ACP methyl ester carboxylesterase